MSVSTSHSLEKNLTANKHRFPRTNRRKEIGRKSAGESVKIVSCSAKPKEFFLSCLQYLSSLTSETNVEAWFTYKTRTEM